MAELTAEQVRALARDMARLDLTEEEAATIARDMGGILEHLSALTAVDVDSAPPVDTGVTAPLRADERTGEAHSGFRIVVPKVVG